MRPSATRPLALLRAPLPRPSGRAWQRPAWRRAFAASAVSAPLLAVLLVPVQAEEPVPPFEGAGRAVARSDDALSTSVTSRLWQAFVQNVIEPLLTLKRFGHLVLIFLPVIITSPLLLAELLSREGARSKASTRFWYRLLVLQMERAGPTFIKLAQWAGSRRDLFPDELCAMFGRLHSNGKPHSLKYTKKVLERAFGRPFEDIFSTFQEEPMGIGAIAQVYKATLKPNLVPAHYHGPKHRDEPSMPSRLAKRILPSSDDHIPPAVPSSTLAIKVLHPRVTKTINRDLKIMSLFANALNWIPGVEWLSFPEEVDAFGRMMTSQVDLRNEGQNLLAFERNFQHRPSISFPRPLVDYTSHDVLVEEYADAVPLHSFLNQTGGPYDDEIANIGLDAFLNMLLIDNFVHADLHPGNIMIKFYRPKPATSTASFLWHAVSDRLKPDGSGEEAALEKESEEDASLVHQLNGLAHDRSAWLEKLDDLHRKGYQPRVVFIDTGLVTNLDDENRRNFLELFAAVAAFDGYRAGELMVERCKAPALVIDKEKFALKMQRLVLQVKSQTFSLAQIRISDILSDVLNNVRGHHVKLEGDFINTVLSILLLEGIGRQLDPNMDLFRNALPILRKVGMQMNTSAISGSLDAATWSSMTQLFFWIEMRQLASMAISEVDRMVALDELTPGC